MAMMSPDKTPKPILYILRGLPGSGKSTHAKTLKGVLISYDAFRVRGGIYAHSSEDRSPYLLAKSIVFGLLPYGCDIILDGVHPRLTSYIDVANAAEAAGYVVLFHYPMTPWAWDAEECAKRGTHSVPVEVIRDMLENFEGRPDVKEA